ncbi:MAG: hypothetical protein COB37_05965 [Kordiimonadales bacterium]|nr:MAG: hypothetical protein COB37_05965 [Kordiimonadales bacterium]
MNVRTYVIAGSCLLIGYIGGQLVAFGPTKWLDAVHYWQTMIAGFMAIAAALMGGVFLSQNTRRQLKARKSERDEDRFQERLATNIPAYNELMPELAKALKIVEIGRSWLVDEEKPHPDSLDHAEKLEPNYDVIAKYCGPDTVVWPQGFASPRIVRIFLQRRDGTDCGDGFSISKEQAAKMFPVIVREQFDPFIEWAKPIVEKRAFITPFRNFGADYGYENLKP